MSSDKFAFATPTTEVQSEWCNGQKGLTKKEYVSVEILKSLISSGIYTEANLKVRDDEVIDLACSISNNLVDEWNRNIFNNM